jgi:hypothetical protein
MVPNEEPRGGVRPVAVLLRQHFRPRTSPDPAQQKRAEPDLRGKPLVASAMSLKDFGNVPDKLEMSRPKLGRLYDWRPLILALECEPVGTAHVVGVDTDTEAWRLTSRVIGTMGDLAIEALDGVYGLGTAGTGELTTGMLELVAAVASEQGIEAGRRLPIARYAPETRGRWRDEAGPSPAEGPRMTRTGPITIDRLVRRHRDMIEVGEAPPIEQQILTGAIEPDNVDRPYEDWRLIAIRDLREDATTLHVVGRRHLSAGECVSPPLTRISPDELLCTTGAGPIRLEGKATGAPTPDCLTAITRALREWGLDEEYGLDVVAPEEIARDTC